MLIAARVLVVVRRAAVDGIEPVDRPNDSVQFELFNYVYHQILRQDAPPTVLKRNLGWQ